MRRMALYAERLAQEMGPGLALGAAGFEEITRVFVKELAMRSASPWVGEGEQRKMPSGVTLRRLLKRTSAMGCVSGGSREHLGLAQEMKR